MGLPIRTRDEHLFDAGSKRILSLDGGGVRGIMTVAFLERIEALLRARHGDDPDFRLADYFDLIGGTSTGSIIATALAMRYSAAEVRELYEDLAPRVFRRPRWQMGGIREKFSDRALRAILTERLGDRPLGSDDLSTGLAIVTRRIDTASTWVVCNNPRGPYWEDDPGGAFIGNRHYLLRDLVRASTAAPYFFVPQRIRIAEGEPDGLFVDGGLSPHNNPAMQLLMVAGLSGHGLNWPISADNILLISVGTGSFRPRIPPGDYERQIAAAKAGRVLSTMIPDGSLYALTLMQWLSTPAAPWPINSEIGDLSDDLLAGRPLIGFQRYDVSLERADVEPVLGEKMCAEILPKLRAMDEPRHMDVRYRLAAAGAAEQVSTEHFPTRFDLTGGSFPDS